MKDVPARVQRKISMTMIYDDDLNGAEGCGIIPRLRTRGLV